MAIAVEAREASLLMERRAPDDFGKPLLCVENLVTGYGKKRAVEIVHNVSFTVGVGEFVCIIGANGCGKTTTLKALMGLIPVWSGDVTIRGESIKGMPEHELAKKFAYIPQAHTPPFPFKVADVVLMGRTPYINKLAQVTQHDKMVAYEALTMLGIEGLAQKAYTQLSGGQQQLVLIARALTQQSEILVMDEPTAALDFGNQQLVLSRMKTLSDMGKAVIMVTHDPDHALFCADRVVVMDKGVILRDGPTSECITTEVLNIIYNIDARVLDVEVEPGRIEKVCLAV